MKNGIKTGIFLCGCGEVIGSRIDLASLENMLKGEDGVVCIRSHSQYCLKPGLAQLAEAVDEHGLNRILIGACSDRIMKKKFLKALKSFGLLDSQIELVNLKDHIALVNHEPKETLTRKAAALLGGAAASLGQLEPCAPACAYFKGPVLILGGGISGFETARELARLKMESILFSDCRNADEVLARLPKAYPGSLLFMDQLKTLLEEVFADPRVTIAPDLPIEYLTGHVGDYRLGLRQPDGETRDFGGSAITVALDRDLVPSERIFTGGGGRVVDQIELEDRLARSDAAPGRTLFWVNADGKDGSELSALSAWRTCQYLIREYPGVNAGMLYPSDIRLPLTTEDRVAARERGIGLYAYEPSVNPVVQSGFLTYMSSRDRLDHEIAWDTLAVSPVPGPIAGKTLQLSGFMRIFSDENGIRKPPLKVKPEQGPVEFPFLAGSACKACDLNEALQQGKRMAREVFRLKQKAQNGGLPSSLVVVSVDENLCEGCGLCSEICTCGSVENVKFTPGPLIRKVDPHTCDGAGSCAAACPSGAIKVLNNTAQQLEARVKSVMSRMIDTDILGFACSWGGQGAAELAAVKNFNYPASFYMIPVRCLGSIDPSIFSMAFLNGANFIMLVGCMPASSCHYGYGVDHTWFRVSLIKKLLDLSGLERRRITLGYVDVNEPEPFVRMVESFTEEAERMGPIDRTEERGKRLLAAHITMQRPRVRWVLGAGLRRPSEPEFPGGLANPVEFDETLHEVIEEEYLCARILGTLRAAPLNPSQVAGALGEKPVRVSRLLDELLKDGRISSQRREGYPYYALVKPR